MTLCLVSVSLSATFLFISCLLSFVAGLMSRVLVADILRQIEWSLPLSSRCLVSKRHNDAGLFVLLSFYLFVFLSFYHVACLDKRQETKRHTKKTKRLCLFVSDKQTGPDNETMRQRDKETKDKETPSLCPSSIIPHSQCPKWDQVCDISPTFPTFPTFVIFLMECVHKKSLLCSSSCGRDHGIPDVFSEFAHNSKRLCSCGRDVSDKFQGCL